VILSSSGITPDDQDLYVSLVTDDQRQLGVVAAQNLVDGFAARGEPGGNVINITGTPGSKAYDDRLAGIESVLSQHPEINVLAVENGNWDQTFSQEVAAGLFTRFANDGGIQGAIGWVDNQSLGIILAAEQAGIDVGTGPGQLLVVGSNCASVGIQAIRDGKMFGTGLQDPTFVGALTEESVAKFLNGDTLDKVTLATNEQITSANVEDHAEACTY
jgi:ABC-type sugar transport system substrate-binding protein